MPSPSISSMAPSTSRRRWGCVRPSRPPPRCRLCGVRGRWSEPVLTAKLLDAGAYGVICPMINSKAEAEMLVGACRYPPRGARSFGPNRALLYGGADYWQHANDEVLVFAMVETREAVKNLDEIVSVEGLDGDYVGPSDLSLSMGKTATLDPQDPEVLAA